MAVYFAPRAQQPWWVAPLTQLATGQIDAMMDRTKEAKTIEAQRGMAGMLSELQKQNPGMSGSDLMTQVMSDKNFARSGEMGQKILERVMADADRKNAEAELMAMGGDTAGMLKPLMLAGRAGVDQRLVSELQNPKLVQRNANLGDRFIGQSINPYTGQVVGDSLDSPMGIDPGTLAQLTQKNDQFNAEMGFKRGQANIQNSRENLSGYTLKQLNNGEWVYVHPTKPAIKTGQIGKTEGKNDNGKWVLDEHGHNIYISPNTAPISSGVVSQLSDKRTYKDPNTLSLKEQVEVLAEQRKNLASPYDPAVNADKIKAIDDKIEALLNPPEPSPTKQGVDQNSMEGEIQEIMKKTGRSREEVLAFINAQAKKGR